MLAAEITPRSANTFIRSSTSPVNDLCQNVEPNKCEETVTSNGYAKYNHVNGRNEEIPTVHISPSAETGSFTNEKVKANTSGDAEEFENYEGCEYLEGCENVHECPHGDTCENEAECDAGDSNKMEISFAAFEKLRTDLERAQSELRSRDDQCRQLSRVRDEVDQEIEELTASLFEEAHKMVNEANVGRANAEKKLYETQLKLDGLQAEVAALKVLVITSTPASPKTSKSNSRKTSSAGSSRMCTYCDTFVYDTNDYNDWAVVEPSSKREVDPVTFQHFVSWIESGCPLKENDLLANILKDDIAPCLRFADEPLSKAVYKSVQSNTLAIEPIQSKPKKCSLCNITGNCPYRIRLSETDLWYPISASCRARIVSVIDFLTFLRYIRQGILKKDINVLYWDMMKHRAEISLARLGMQKRVGNKK